MLASSKRRTHTTRSQNEKYSTNEKKKQRKRTYKTITKTTGRRSKAKIEDESRTYSERLNEHIVRERDAKCKSSRWKCKVLILMDHIIRIPLNWEVELLVGCFSFHFNSRSLRHTLVLIYWNIVRYRTMGVLYNICEPVYVFVKLKLFESLVI